MTFMKIIFLGIIIAALISCQSLSKSSNQGSKSSSPERAAGGGLSEEQASYRSSLVSRVKYDLSVSLSPDAPLFTGDETITFDLKSQRPLTLDFADGQILSLTVNEKTVSTPVYNKEFLSLPVEFLRTGSNTVKIKYSHAYSTSGSGLYRFKDPEDGKSYLFTDFEPFSANKLFPCFDQPDLKATYTIKAETPQDWTVVSSTNVQSVKPSTDGRTLWIFPESDTFSTYLVSLHAGPFKH
jgi:aminopeptidase N